MGRKIRRVKSFVKNAILGAITVFAFVMWIASADAMADMQPRAFVIFIVSAIWMLAFFKANNFFNEKECR